MGKNTRGAGIAKGPDSGAQAGVPSLPHGLQGAFPPPPCVLWPSLCCTSSHWPKFHLLDHSNHAQWHSWKGCLPPTRSCHGDLQSVMRMVCFFLEITTRVIFHPVDPGQSRNGVCRPAVRSRRCRVETDALRQWGGGVRLSVLGTWHSTP